MGVRISFRPGKRERNMLDREMERTQENQSELLNRIIRSQLSLFPDDYAQDIKTMIVEIHAKLKKVNNEN